MSISIIVLENGSILKKTQIINDDNIILYSLLNILHDVSNTSKSILNSYYDIDVNDSLLIIEIINEFENKYNIMLVGLSKDKNYDFKNKLLKSIKE